MTSCLHKLTSVCLLSSVFLTKCLKVYLTLREKCPYAELFWSVFSWIQNEYFISPYSVQMRENTDQNTDTFYAVRAEDFKRWYKRI